MIRLFCVSIIPVPLNCIIFFGEIVMSVLELAIVGICCASILNVESISKVCVDAVPIAIPEYYSSCFVTSCDMSFIGLYFVQILCIGAVTASVFIVDFVLLVFEFL